MGKEVVRVWPHHFDSGGLAVLSQDEKGAMTKTIGFGFAIADADIPEHYYYINHWARDFTPDYQQFAVLPEGGRWLQSHWTGAVLPISAVNNLNNRDAQYELVKAFFKEGISASKSLIRA